MSSLVIQLPSIAGKRFPEAPLFVS